MNKSDKESLIELIESYQIIEDGFHPFLIRDGWQVAQLNYVEEQNIENISKIDVHYQTDEVFVLLNGKAVLIVATFKDDIPFFEVELMKQNTIYNIPKNRWHNIAMEEESKVLIVEKSNTHLSDFDYFNLDSEKRSELKYKVEELLK
ncbi:hypothetical protein [Flavivirga spongiicola]|uniref:Cupin n=1 Tax=Flavivirga spongiicola TaxID=421621 RepID=A0ABU7XR24_9FLAO|nr:hypothetical protein [Flavivirga sp. MEBiC05379]MDO5977893.1 hypothetical protein [Flavivirga sp. MEBiC05379]